MEKQPPFTKSERFIMDKTIDIWNEFIGMETMHQTEKTEMMTAIHQIQSIMSHRVMKRTYPTYFR